MLIGTHLLNTKKNIKKMKTLEQLTDEELATRYVDGNNRAFDVLLNRTQSKIFSYILFIVHDRDKADDIFQETFLKVIYRLQQGMYAATGKFIAWVMRIAHNVIMDQFRDNAAEPTVELAADNNLANMGGALVEGNIEGHFVNTQVMTDVRRLLDNLPTPQREVVYMRFYQDMSFREIAETTSVSINTALGRMRYALLNMRRMARENDVMLQIV